MPIQADYPYITKAMAVQENEAQVPLLKNYSLKELEEVNGDVVVDGEFSVDEILKEWAGEFGWAQLLHFTLTSLAWVIIAMQTLVMIFAEKTPSWQCIEGDSGSTNGSTCSPHSSICSMDPKMWEWVGGRSQSTVSEWNLICNNEYKVGLVQSFYFIGCFTGAGLFGSLSDSFLGRKWTLTIACTLSALCGFTAYSPTYWVYVIMRFLTGVSSGGISTSCFILATEPIGPSKRGPAGMSTFYFYSLGIFLLVGVAFTSHTWSQLYISTCCLSFMYCLTILPFLSESPRWYLVKGRTDEALKTLRSIARRNGRRIPSGVRVSVEKRTNEAEGTDQEEANVAVVSKKELVTLIDAFKAPAIRLRMLLMVYVWFSVALIYYGISLNAGNLGTNLYASVFLNGLAEMPSLAISAILLSKIGRRTLLVFALLLSGTSCLVGTIVTQYQSSVLQSSEARVIKRTGLVKTIKLVLSMLGIFGMGASYNVLYIYTAELFPTVVRNAAMGFTNQAAQIGCVIAPLVVLSGHRHPAFPFGINAVVSILAGFVCLKLVETSNRPLYETLYGMERCEALEKQCQSEICTK